MLVLSRKINEKIVIGSDIEITILSSNDGSVKLGIDAPNSVAVYRYEVYAKIREFISEATVKSVNLPFSEIKNAKINKYAKK